jgi:hypothetical protein
MAERAQEAATKTAWATFAAMVISLAAAVAGAMVGRRRAETRALRAATVETGDTSYRR